MATSSRQTHAHPVDDHRLDTQSQNQQHDRQEYVQHDGDPLLRMLVLLQRQQHEQLQLLRQLLQEVESLKQSQSQQNTKVEKLDRRLQRARLLRITWHFIRWALFISVIGAIIYLIGVGQIMAIWQRLVWFMT